MTLQDILEAMAKQQENFDAISESEVNDILVLLGEKVDGYKHIISLCEAEEERLANEIKDFQKSKKTVENAKERVKETLMYVMKSKEYSKLPGEKFVANIRSRTTSFINRSPDEADYIGFEDLVKIAFAWDVSKVKEAAKTDPKAAELLEERTTEYVQFTVRKGIEK